MRRKAQSAMEYLSTYGWMILVIVLILALLFAMGAFNPKTRDMCDFGSDLYCGNIKLTPKKLMLSLKNGFPYSITICGLSCRDKEDYETTTYTVSQCPIPSGTGHHIDGTAGITITPGGEARINQTRSEGPCRYDSNADAVKTVGETYSGHISIFYYRSGDLQNSMQRVVRGRIVATVQPEVV